MSPRCAFVTTALFIGYVLGYGIILEPSHRSNVGPAATAACGPGIVSYLAANPGASTGDVGAHQGSDTVTAACNIQYCNGYQRADNLANVVTLPSKQDLLVTVNYTVPSQPPPGSGDFYDNYEPILTLMNATSGYEVTYPFQYDLAPNTPQVLDYWSFDKLWNYGGAPGEFFGILPGMCSTPGECYISFQLMNCFQSPHLDSCRYLDAGCIDIIVDWTD